MRNVVRSVAASCTALAALALLSGCRSPWIQATIVNLQSAPVSIVEVNYPGGTFGIQSIAAGSSFHYRFRLLSTGPVSIDFTDGSQHSHTATGPELQQGTEGTLRIDIEPDSQVRWAPALTAHR